MDMASLSQAIGSLGFPICACAAMAYYIYKSNATHLKQIDDLNTKHYQEMRAMVDAVNNNTAAIQQLSKLIGVEQQRQLDYTQM